MFKILLQSGHQNITNGQTGAPGEMEANIRFRDKLGQVLISKGFQVFLCDANYIGTQDFNLSLAIHCDANVYGTGGGFVDYPDPSVDMSNAESKRIKEAIESEYFKNSGIVNHPERSNPNTKFYYWWSMLTANTPCVIIETCVIQDPHDSVIAADPKIIPNAIARGICKAFNVPYDPVTTTTLPPTTTTLPLTTTTVLPADYRKYLVQIKDIAYGTGWPWTKVSKVKDILKQAGV